MARDVDFMLAMRTPTREHLLNSLYEAAELEHNLMCMYLYAAFTIKTEPADGVTAAQAERAVTWRRAIMNVAIEEMGHLAAVWNITSALGASPRFGRNNFPIEAGPLPASVVARLAPFDDDVLQHFVYLERPLCSRDDDPASFPHAPPRKRGTPYASLTPMPIDYDTVGAFYATLGQDLIAFIDHHGDAGAFCNDTSLQLTDAEVDLPGLLAVRCSKTALASFTSIVEQGEGAPADRQGSHFQVFRRVRRELAEARVQDPAYVAMFPAARDPVLRPPISEARVWIADADAGAVVDLANATYNLMLRMLAYAYQVPHGAPEKRVAVDCALGLMRAMTPIAERAVRLPVGPAHPGVNAGMTFTALRDTAPLPPGSCAWQMFGERFDELIEVAAALAKANDPRIVRARHVLEQLKARARRAGPASAPVEAATASSATVEPPPPEAAAPETTTAPLITGGKRTQGRFLTVLYDGKRCIHARRCVTGLPKVFEANVTKGPWIHPDEADPDRVVEIIHQCPSGALRYERADGKNEPAPPVNLVALAERGPYMMRADLQLAGAPGGYRLTLCRCGASKNKPFCDNTHRAIDFDATGEPPSTKKIDPLPDRAGPLSVEPTLDGPLELEGNVEIISGSGRTIARMTHTKLCRCGASASKPFCDQSHRRIGFRSEG